MMRILHPFRGERLSLVAIARRTGIDRRVIGERIAKGMTAEEAVTTPIIPRPRPEPKRYLYQDRWLTMKEAAALIGCAVGTVRKRVSGDRILDAQDRIDAALISHDGRTLSVTEWAKITGLSRATIFTRLFNGWSPDRALSTPPAPSGRGAPKARNRRILKRISRSIWRHRLEAMGIRATTITPSTSSTITITGGCLQTFALTTGTGGRRRETHFEGAS